MLEDFIITDMIETDDAEIILSRPFLTILGCNIDVKRGWIAFKVQGSYAMFFHMEEKVVSSSSSLSDTFRLSPEIDMEDALNCQDPPDFDWILTEDPNQGHVLL